MTFRAEADSAISHAMLNTFVAAGGTLVDTADAYSSGVSEQIIGTWLAAHPVEREQIVLATKGRFPMGSGSNDLGTSRRHLIRALDDSPRRLGTEHIDLYQLHAWDPITPLDETLRFLDDATRAGTIGYWGVSNFTGWHRDNITTELGRIGLGHIRILSPERKRQETGTVQNGLPAPATAADCNDTSSALSRQ